MHHDEKLRMAHQLAALGVDVLEAGFAIASDGDFDSVRAIARAVHKAHPSPRSPAASARTSRPPPAPSSPPRAAASTSSSPPPTSISTAKLRINREQALDQIAEMVALARTYVDDVEFSPEDATRTDPDFLIKVCEVAIQAGATTLNLPDTVGYSIPDDYAAIFRDGPRPRPRHRKRHPLHPLPRRPRHGRRQLPRRVEAGARQVECTINGIGERAGNAALEEIAAILTVRQRQAALHATTSS